MDRYHLWFDLRPGVRDLDLADAVTAHLEALREARLLLGWTLERRKLGFGPAGLGEWHVAIETEDLAQLDRCFSVVARRTGEQERLHAAVWSKVQGLQTALYRDFPDPVRVRSGPAAQAVPPGPGA